MLCFCFTVYQSCVFLMYLGRPCLLQQAPRLPPLEGRFQRQVLGLIGQLLVRTYEPTSACSSKTLLAINSPWLHTPSFLNSPQLSTHQPP